MRESLSAVAATIGLAIISILLWIGLAVGLPSPPFDPAPSIPSPFVIIAIQLAKIAGLSVVLSGSTGARTIAVVSSALSGLLIVTVSPLLESPRVALEGLGAVAFALLALLVVEAASLLTLASGTVSDQGEGRPLVGRTASHYSESMSEGGSRRRGRAHVALAVAGIGALLGVIAASQQPVAAVGYPASAQVFGAVVMAASLAGPLASLGFAARGSMNAGSVAAVGCAIVVVGCLSSLLSARASTSDIVITLTLGLCLGYAVALGLTVQAMRGQR